MKDKLENFSLFWDWVFFFLSPAIFKLIVGSILHMRVRVKFTSQICHHTNGECSRQVNYKDFCRLICSELYMCH